MSENANGPEYVHGMKIEKDSINLGGDADIAPTTPFLINLPDGSVAWPSTRHFVATWCGMTGERYVLCAMSYGNLHLQQLYTPEGARQLAQSLLTAADVTEAHLARQAAAQLAATLGKAPR